MDRRKTLRQFVTRAKRSLNIEKYIPSLQYGILLAVVFYTAILLLSRLFVLPYYHNIALFFGVSVFLLTIVYLVVKRVKTHDALIRLDAFYPHNELVTALSLNDDMNPLVNSILQKAVLESNDSFERFKQRKKSLWRPKALISLLFFSIAIGVLYIFPSPTQQEAVTIEKENEAIDKLEKEVAELEKKATNDEVKKQLQELLNKLKQVDSSEEALREVVKKQKELKLQEQNLKEKRDLASKGNDGAEGLTSEEEERLKELLDIQNLLTKSASLAQTALSQLGKPISFELQNAIASESGSSPSEEGSPNQDGGNSGDSSNTDNSQGQQNNGESNQGSGENGSQGQGTNGSQGQGSGNGSGSQGNGSGSGTGQGQGNGNGAGFGQGGRDLLSIPRRIGENGELIVDGGPLGEGSPIEEQDGPVPVTKGTIRPYEEVIGQYKDRYMESSERMQLPKDLQEIVQSYFSSLESE